MFARRLLHTYDCIRTLPFFREVLRAKVRQERPAASQKRDDRRKAALPVVVATVVSCVWMPVALAQSDTWTTKASMPTARYALGSAEIDGKLYAVGGVIGLSGYLSTLEVYDPATDTWTTRSSMPTARYAL